jgi:hypothetical protein
MAGGILIPRPGRGRRHIIGHFRRFLCPSCGQSCGPSCVARGRGACDGGDQRLPAELTSAAAVFGVEHVLRPNEQCPFQNQLRV